MSRWIEEGDLHLTLHFLGSTPPDATFRLLEALATAQFPDKHEQTLSEFVAFPSFRAAGVFGLASREVAPPLLSLWHSLRETLHHLGLPKDERPLWPHLTLVRFRRRQRLPPTHSGLSPRVSLPITSVTLFQSTPTPAGSRYEPLGEFPLADPRGK